MAQSKSYDVTKDSANGSLIFRGTISLADMESEPTFTWLKTGAENYEPNPELKPFLSQNLPSYDIVVFLGTWCDDSHYWIPKLLKLLRQINYPIEKIKWYGVDRTKTTRNGENTSYNITLVPTIILLKDGHEKGRITEGPQNGLEGDLMAIIKN